MILLLRKSHEKPQGAASETSPRGRLTLICRSSSPTGKPDRRDSRGDYGACGNAYVESPHDERS
jgi:hypothetical protein